MAQTPLPGRSVQTFGGVCPIRKRFLRVALENALNLVGKGGEDPRKLHFDAQGIAHNEDFSRDRLTKGHNPQIRSLAAPIHLAVSKLINVVTAQMFQPLDDSPLRFVAPRLCGTVTTIEFDMRVPPRRPSCNHF